MRSDPPDYICKLAASDALRIFRRQGKKNIVDEVLKESVERAMREDRRERRQERRQEEWERSLDSL